MTLILSPEMLEHAYSYLRVTPPFRRWGLLEADDVEFAIGRVDSCRGWYDRVGDQHRITISERNVGRTESLMMTMAHEMIHLYQAIKGSETAAQHNAEWHLLALQVCRHHGFDPKLF